MANDLNRRKVERLAEALNTPEDRAEASTAVRGLIEKMELTPGPEKGEMHATLHGELSLIGCTHPGKTAFRMRGDGAKLRS